MLNKVPSMIYSRVLTGRERRDNYRYIAKMYGDKLPITMRIKFWILDKFESYAKEHGDD